MTFQRPRPVLTTTGIAGAITSLAAILAFLGYNEASAHLSAETQTLTAIVIGAVTIGSHLLAGLHAQAKVTPIHDAKADDGTPLVRADSVAAGFDSRSEAVVHTLVTDEHPDETQIEFTADDAPAAV